MRLLLPALVFVIFLVRPVSAEIQSATNNASADKVDVTHAREEAKPLEEVLALEKNPNGKHIKVLTHILVIDPDKKGVMHVKFADIKGSPAVNIKIWDPKLRDLKPNTKLAVTGELHFGTVPGGTPSIRYKVKEISGRKYNDHRHWRTDRAIYIINPTYKICDGEGKEPEKN